MLDLTDRENDAMAVRRDDRDRVDYIRHLVLARVPEATEEEIVEAFADDETGEAFADSADNADRNAEVLASIADAVGDAIEALEERLTELERALPWRVH